MNATATPSFPGIWQVESYLENDASLSTYELVITADSGGDPNVLDGHITANNAPDVVLHGTLDMEGRCWRGSIDQPSQPTKSFYFLITQEGGLFYGSIQENQIQRWTVLGKKTA